MSRKLPTLITIGIVLMAGCAVQTGPSTETPTNTQTVEKTEIETTQYQFSNSSGIERVLQTESNRVENLLVSNDNFSDVAVGSGTGTILKRNSSTAIVKATVSYGYSYNCTTASGSVDSESIAIYEVTDNQVKLVEMKSSVVGSCSDLT